MKQKLPTELILKILKIKHYTAIKSRLEKILKFPKLNKKYLDYNIYGIEYNTHYFYLKCKNGFVHRWIYEFFYGRPQGNFWCLSKYDKNDSNKFYSCNSRFPI
jgi:hypothetical protein